MFATRADIREVWSQAWPAAISMLSWAVMQFIDSLMVAGLGDAAVAAQSNGGSIAWAPMSFGFGLLALVNTLVAQRVGAKRTNEIARYGWAGVWIAVAYALLVLLPYGAIVGPVLRTYEVHSPEILDGEIAYMRIVLAAGVFTLLGKAIANFFYGLQRPKVVTVAALAGNVANVVGNYVFIFGEQGATVLGVDLPGLPGAPALGIAGAAVGTAIGSAVEALLPFALFLAPRLDREYSVRRAWRPDFRAMREIVRLGSPAGLQLLSESGSWAIFMVYLVGTFGEAHNAAGSAVMKYIMLSFMPALGIANAATAVVGKHIGEGNLDAAKRSGHAAVFIAAAWMTLCGACFLVFRAELAAVFLDSEEAIGIAATLFVFAALFQTLDALGTVYAHALRGAGDTLVPGLATVVLSWTVILGGGFYLRAAHPELSSTGPWIAATAYIVLLGLFLTVRFERGGWRRIHLLDGEGGRGDGSTRL
ncbi:MAG: MATE family efflux transporter [Phycisphaerales bacterium]